MRSPAAHLRAFLLWRLTSGWWLYAMIAAGWGLIVSSLAFLVLWAWLRFSVAWPGVAMVGCLGAGIFFLLFEVGWTDLRLAARESMRIRRIRGDDELYEQMLVDGRRRKRVREKFEDA